MASKDGHHCWDSRASQKHNRDKAGQRTLVMKKSESSGSLASFAIRRSNYDLKTKATQRRVGSTCRSTTGLMSEAMANKTQNIEFQQRDPDEAGFKRRLDERTVEGADAEHSRHLLVEAALDPLGKEVGDVGSAQEIQDEDLHTFDEICDQEDEDAAMARRLWKEEQEHLQSVDHDRVLAATLQREHGRAGKMLSRASQLEEFLSAPLYSRPLPVKSDLAPETLRRIVALTQQKTSSLCSSGTLPGCSRRSKSFRAAGSVIAASSIRV